MSTTPSQREKRRQPRYTVDLPVLVSDARREGDGGITFDTRDLSVGGAFLRSDLLFEVGEELQVELELPDDDGGPITTRARVVHVVREPDEGTVPGMGIAFERLADRDRDRVRAFLSRAPA